MISLRGFKASTEVRGILLLLLVDLYLVLYVLDVYGINMPINPSTYRMYIFYVIIIVAVPLLVFRPEIDQVEKHIILYSIVVVAGQYINGLFTLSRVANDLFFPVILFTFRRYFFAMNADRIKKIVKCECIFNIIFFVLFLYASFSMRLRYGMYLNSCYYCALLLPFVLSIEKPTLRNVMTLVCLIPSVLSMKRGAYLSVVLGIAIFYIAIRKTEEFRENRKRYAWWAFGTIFGVALVMIIMRHRYQLSMIERLLDASSNGGSGRIDLIRGMIILLGKNGIIGFLIGHGSFTSSQFLGFSSHNDFLEMLWSYGLLGFLPYILIISSFFKTCKKLKLKGSKFYAPSLACLVEFIICSMVSQLVFVPTYVAFLLMFFAFAETQSRETNHKKMVR